MLQLIHSLLINDASNQCCYTNPSWKLTLGFGGITELAVSAQSHRVHRKGSYSGEEREMESARGMSQQLQWLFLFKIFKHCIISDGTTPCPLFTPFWDVLNRLWGRAQTWLKNAIQDVIVRGTQSTKSPKWQQKEDPNTPECKFPVPLDKVTTKGLLPSLLAFFSAWCCYETTALSSSLHQRTKTQCFSKLWQLKPREEMADAGRQ